MGQRLSRDQERAIAALLTSPTCGEAAEKLNLHANTLRGWLKQPAFLAAYTEAREELLAKTIGRLHHSMFAVTDALLKDLKSKDAAVRHRAAELLLSNTVKATEVQGLNRQLAELLAKVAQLEGSD